MLISGREWIVLIAGYALGCVSTGYYLVWFRAGRDIRQFGSGSTGGTNVGRVLGAPGFAMTMLGDLAKGAISLWAGTYLGLQPWLLALLILAVVAGHIFPVQLGFHGGKGLATALGAMLVFDFRLTVVVIALAGILGAISKQFTLGLMVAIAATPVSATLVGHTWAETVGLALTALVILFAHRTNIAAALSSIRGRSD